MTRVYEEEVVPESTRKVLKKVVCDLCGREGNGFDVWAKSHYDIKETNVLAEVSFDDGYSYPEGGEKTTIYFDICPDCFMKVLVPFLEEKGVAHHTMEMDW
jgi:hypothetical protein